MLTLIDKEDCSGKQNMGIFRSKKNIQKFIMNRVHTDTMDKDLFKKIINAYRHLIIYIEEDIPINNKIPDGCGVYIFETDNKQSYISSSFDIRRKINEKLLEFHNIESVNVYLTDNYQNARTISQELILRLRPELNRLK